MLRGDWMISWRIGGKNTLALLLCGFSVIILLMISITHQSLSQLGHSKSRLDNIVLVHNQKAVLIDEMQHANRERVISLQNMLITDDFFELDAAAIHNMQMAGQFLLAREKLEAMPLTSGEKELLTDLRRAADRSGPMNDTVREMLWYDKANSYDAAKDILTEDVLSAQNEIYDVFGQLTDLYQAANDRAVHNSTREHGSARSLILTMLEVTVLLGVGIALYVTYLILRNERMLKDHGTTLETLVQDRTRELQRISTDAVAARQEAEDASSAKSTFLANMSHELRTPLNAVLGFSEVMDLQIMGPLPVKYRQYPRHIHDSAHHLLQMIEQLLDMSKIEAGHLELREERVCLRSLTDEAITIIRSAFSRTDDALYKTPDSVGIALHGDERLLRQTLINIISNAAKYSEPGDPAIEVRVACDGGDAVITVRDHGIGIDADEIPRLFNPYERSNARTARARQGTGLGLAISRSLVEVHGGRLTLDSTLGEGTTVTITLPAARVLQIKPPVALRVTASA